MSDTPIPPLPLKSAGPGPPRRPDLAALLLDQRLRFRDNKHRPVEFYLEQHPSLSADPESLLDLIFNEVILRGQRGEQPRLEDYLDRFPHVAAQLRLQFEMEKVLEANGLLPSTPDLDTEIVSQEDSPTRPASAGPVDIAGYEILGVLGRGGMGIVYKAWQVQLKRVVALKMILAENDTNLDLLARFQTEAEAVARLQHPNIVQVYEVGEEGGRPYLALEYVNGGGLEKKLDGTPQPPRQAAALVEILARAMHHAHEAGILHRDLKPANILLANGGVVSGGVVSGGVVSGEDAVAATTHHSPLTTHLLLTSYQPKITDFGLAKIFIGGGDTRTQRGAILGTPSYIAPEQAQGQADKIGPATDVYSLGAILYELLTGRPPFKGETPLDTLRLVLAETPLPVSRLQREVPHDLETICLHSLQKEPGKRYASALALADDLRRFLEGKPIQARPVSRRERLWRWCRRNPALAVTSGLAALMLLTAAGLAVCFGVYQYHAAANLRGALEDVRRQQSQASRLAANLAWDRGRGLCEQGEVGHGLLWLASGLATAPAEDADLHEALRAELAGWELKCHALQAVVPHPDKVLATTLSDDGRSALTGCADGAARLWEAATGKLRATLRGHQAAVCAVALLTDGKTALTGSADGTARLWDTASAVPLEPPLRHQAAVAAVAVSADGRLALTGSADRTVRLWELPAGRPRGVALQHPGAVEALALSRDGRTILTACWDSDQKRGQARLWEASTGRPIGAPLSNQKRIRAVAFSPDGRVLLTGDDDWDAQLWEASTGKALAILKHYGSVQAVAFSPDGQTVLTGCEDTATGHVWAVGALLKRRAGTPALLDVKNALSTSLPHPASVTAVAFGPDGRTMLTGSADGARLWRLSLGYEGDLSLAHPQPVCGLAFAKDGKRFLTACNNGTVQLWDAVTGGRLGPPLAHPARARVLTFALDDKAAVTGCEDGAVRFWDLATGTVAGALLRHPGPVDALAISPDGHLLVIGGKDGTAQLWNVATRQPAGPPLPHQLSVDGAAFSPDGRLLLTGSEDGTAQLWHTSSGRAAGPLLRHQGRISCVAFAPDGRTVLTASADRTARLWDAATGRLLLSLPHKREVVSVAYSPDGRFVVTAGYDFSAQLWSAGVGKRVGPPLGHRAMVYTAIFSPDGRGLLTGSWDRTAQLRHVPAPFSGDVKRIKLRLQLHTGMELDSAGGVHVLDASLWTVRHQHFENSRNSP